MPSKAILFLSFGTAQKVARGMRLTYFFTSLMPFNTQISSLTKPVITQLISKSLQARIQNFYTEGHQKDMITRLYLSFA